MTHSRRALLAALPALALGACAPREAAGAAGTQALQAPPLRRLAPFPVGTAAMTGQLRDPQWSRLALGAFDQVTPEWEMKMERILEEDGSLDFAAADDIADFCRAHGFRLHATTLVWYAQSPPAFRQLTGDPSTFRSRLADYIGAVMGRYRGLARGWDVVNEAVAEDGNGYRGGVWAEGLGPGFAQEAFEMARASDPDAILFLNDYNLEIMPAKLDAFQRLAERLLSAGAPLGGLGTQSHLDIGLAPGTAGRAVRALARFGLPIHVSELDISTRTPGLDLRPVAERLQAQARVAAEIAEAFMELPPAQRYAFTLWGVRDEDSWLRHAAGGAADEPLLFDVAGDPKPACAAVAAAFAGRT